MVRKKRPESRLTLQYDKLYVDNAVYIFNEDAAQIGRSSFNLPRQKSGIAHTGGGSFLSVDLGLLGIFFVLFRAILGLDDP